MCTCPEAGLSFSQTLSSLQTTLKGRNIGEWPPYTGSTEQDIWLFWGYVWEINGDIADSAFSDSSVTAQFQRGRVGWWRARLAVTSPIRGRNRVETGGGNYIMMAWGGQLIKRGCEISRPPALSSQPARPGDARVSHGPCYWEWPGSPDTPQRSPDTPQRSPVLCALGKTSLDK